MKNLSRLILVILIGHCFLNALDPWYNQSKRGWYYFEDNKQQETKKEDFPKANVSTAPQIIEDEKQKTHELLCLALINPTEENIGEYLKQQKKLIDLSARFASSWKAVLLQHPEYSYDLPQTAYGQRLKKSQEEINLAKRLNQYKQEHFLLFVFKGKDVFSKEQAKVVEQFSKMGEWQVRAISLDGVVVSQFPGSEINPSASEFLKLRIAPALYLVNPTENYMMAVSFGLVDYETIEKNIDFQMQRKEDPNHAL